MGMYKYIRDIYRKPQENLGDLWKQRLMKWRKEPATVRIERPTRLDRARSLGYKAKPGYIIVRQRLMRGGHQKPDIKGGRRPKTSSQRLDLRKNYQEVAEERANKHYPNCEVLNSYWIAQDGKNYWFEIILVDRASPSIVSDPHINWICEKRGRVFRGLTSSARKARGLRWKGKGSEKARPQRNP